MTRTIPITPEKLAGDVLEAFHRQYLGGSELAAWANALMSEGFDSDTIIQALVSPSMHWEKVPMILSGICRELGLSQDIAAEVSVVKQEVMIEECCKGYRRAAELFWRFDDLRKRVGFPEMIEWRLLEDNPDGTNDSGFYGIDSRRHGSALENICRECLENAGILS